MDRKSAESTVVWADAGAGELQRWESWLEGMDRPTKIMTPTFEVDFNLEYWSCQLFGGCSKEAKKIYEIKDEGEKVLGRIEVGAYAGMNLEPFDRLVMLALIQLWYDQGGDPEGRLAFSYRELFRRLGLKAGGRQSQQIKNALDRLRRCFITLTNCFMTRKDSGETVPVETEADPFTILRLKQTATIGSGRKASHLVVCQLSPVVLMGLREEGRMRPRIHSGVLQKLRAKNSTAILLHGYYNGRLRQGEQRFFEYKVLGRALRMQEQFHSNLVNRLLNPHEKLESISAIKIAEARGDRRGKGLTVTLMAPPGEEERVISIRIDQEPVRVPLSDKDRDQLALFQETAVEYDEQVLMGFRAAGVKNIKYLLRRYGKNTPEKVLWALLENIRAKNADEKWEWRRGPDAYVAKCLNDGFYIPDDYKTPKERYKEAQEIEIERLRVQEEQALKEQAAEDRLASAERRLSSGERVRLEEQAIARISQGLKPLLKKVEGCDPEAPVAERYLGLTNSIVKEAFEGEYRKLLQSMSEDLEF